MLNKNELKSIYFENDIKYCYFLMNNSYNKTKDYK